MLRRNTNLAPKKKFSNINVTPFVDVVLVLLIIFMITAPSMDKGIKLDLPKLKAGTVKVDETPLVLNINAKEKLYIDETQIPVKNLNYRIKLLLKQKKNKAVFLRADKNAKYGFVAKVINNIKKAGVSKVALITEDPEEKGKEASK